MKSAAKKHNAKVVSGPMYHLPDDDAPLTEWLRPVSAMLKTRRTSYFSNEDPPGADAGGNSAMIQRINRSRRKRAAKINMREFWHLHAQGMAVNEMAERLCVSTRSVDRALKMRHVDDV